MKLSYKQGNRYGQQGAALLTVLVALMLISLMTLELQYTSLVERKLAYNDLNQLQAHYLAKSGVHLGILRLALYGRVTKNATLKQNFSQYVNQIWSLPFPPFPMDTGALGKLSLQEKSAQEALLKQTRISQGTFAYTIASESGKLNLNLLASTNGTVPDFRNRPNQLNEYIGHNLLNKIERLFQESEDPQAEFGNVRAEEIIYNIMDWVTPGDSAFGAGNKDAWYEQQVPPYKAKRGPFFTLDEVKLVKDISPSLFLKLKPLVTVFSENGRIDLDVASARGKSTLRDMYSFFTDKDLEQIWTHLEQSGGTWGTVQNFTNYMSSNFPRFIDQYPANLHPQVFTIGSETFLVKSQGQIKKSGSTIQRNIVVAAALSTVGCPEIAGVTNLQDCSNQSGFVFSDGKCYTQPTTIDQCRSCRHSSGAPMANPQANGTDCQVFGQNSKFPSSPYTLAFGAGANATSSSVQTFNGLKVYSWVES